MGETRRSGPGSKTRSGCVTCKARRVKCDETKPFCMRCQNLRLECGGYKVKQKPTHSAQRLLPLVPKIEPISTKVDPLALNLAQSLFGNDQDFNYFKVFAGTTAPSLGEYFDAPIWSYIVLQASEQEHFIKHAIIALGALNKSLDTTTASGEISGRALIFGSPHYQVAFQHYGKSIQGIRKACQEQRKSRRTILIACLLAVCFEYYHGNMDLAIAHSQNGIKLIDEWFLSVMHLTKVDGQQFLQGVIEDELISIFTRLQLDINAWHEVGHIEMHPELQKVAAGIILAIPSKGFENLTAARRYFDILLTQVDWFIYSMREQAWAIADASVESIPATAVEHPAGTIVLSKTQQQRWDFLKEALVSWRRAFQHVLTQSLKSGGKDVLVAKSLALRFICSAVALHCCPGPERTYDDYLPEFRAALQLARTVSDATVSKTKYTFIVSSIMIRSLWFIAWKCRETSVRTEARDHLQAMSRREGIWDSKVASTVATVIIELEDSGGIIPENNRLRAIKTSFDIHQRQGKLRFLTATTGPRTVGFVAHRMDFGW